MVLICTNDTVLLPVFCFPHKASCFLLFHVDIWKTIFYYFFLILSIPSYASTAFCLHILVMMSTWVASKWLLWAGSLCTDLWLQWECDTRGYLEDERDSFGPRLWGAHIPAVLKNQQEVYVADWRKRGRARSRGHRGSRGADQTALQTLEMVQGLMLHVTGSHWRALRKRVACLWKAHSAYWSRL